MYNREERDFIKYFDSKNRLLLSIEGNLKTTDSSVYKYNSDNSIKEVWDYIPNENGKLVLSYKNIVNSNIPSEKEYICPYIVDTFGLTYEYDYIDIDKNFKNIMKVDSINTDSGLIYKYNYKINEVIFLLLPYVSNNNGSENAESLDSMNFVCFNKQIVSEDYYFEKEVHIERKYFYSKTRLIKTTINLYSSNKYKEGFDEIFRYKYVNK